MSDHHVYKKVEIVGSSKTSIEDAIQNALDECGRSVRNMEWFEVTETRGHIVDGKVDASSPQPQGCCWRPTEGGRPGATAGRQAGPRRI